VITGSSDRRIYASYAGRHYIRKRGKISIFTGQFGKGRKTRLPSSRDRDGKTKKDKVLTGQNEKEGLADRRIPPA